jgi:hypothetical protein
MENRDPGSAKSPPKAKRPWERPTVTFAGTISLLVRAGSAMGKAGGNMDGDSSQFQTCTPNRDPNCPP